MLGTGREHPAAHVCALIVPYDSLYMINVWILIPGVTDIIGPVNE